MNIVIGIFILYILIVSWYCVSRMTEHNTLTNIFKTLYTDFIGWSIKEYIWLIVAPMIIIALTIIMGSSHTELICGITGIICAILIAKGKVSGYIWGFTNTLLYGIISYDYKLYGETIVYLWIFLPMQIIGMYWWIKNSQINDNSTIDVVKKLMSIKLRLILIVSVLASIAIYMEILSLLKGSFIGLDAATSILSIVATVLMLLRYAEQWIMWIIVNIVTIVLWVMAVLEHQTQGWAILAMWIVFLMNSIYGWYSWSRKVVSYES